MTSNLLEEGNALADNYLALLRKLFHSIQKGHKEAANVMDQILETEAKMQDLLTRIAEHIQIQQSINEKKQALLNYTKTNLVLS